MIAAAHEQRVRTGTFRYVRHEEIEDFHRIGWMIVADLGPVHRYWSVLMWRCACREALKHG